MPSTALAANSGNAAKKTANAHADAREASRFSSRVMSTSAPRSKPTPHTRAHVSGATCSNAPTASHAVHRGEEKPITRWPAL